MISVDLKDAYLQVPIYPDSHKFLHFVVDGKIFQFPCSMLRSLQGPSSVYKGHGSGVSHASQPGKRNATVFRRLADSRLNLSGGIAGEGHCFSCAQSREL